MAKYIVTVREVVFRDYVVEAENPQEAEDFVSASTEVELRPLLIEQSMCGGSSNCTYYGLESTREVNVKNE